MRVGLLSYNARARDAIGNHVAETAALFLDRGAAVRVFVESADHVHPTLQAFTQIVDRFEPHGAVWEFLAGADLVIVQYAQACRLLHFLPLLAGGKPRILLDYHGVTPPALWSGSNREALELGVRRRGLVWSTDAAIAHSAFTQRELSAATGFAAERIHRLPLVVDHSRFHPGTDESLRQRLGIADGKLLLYVGRLAGNKRVPMLVEALAHLPADVHGVVIGDTGDVYAAEAERCRERARELSVASRLHFPGTVSDPELAAAYRGADVLVIPSVHEGFCIPVIEAMASGLPVVAARAAALPETIADAGLTFTPDDALDLARQIRRALQANPSAVARPPRTGEPRRQIAIVCFRFGATVVGGAETSLRTIARSLQSAGHVVEVFTTCTRSESDWRNELPAGTTSCDGLTVHRFPIDTHDRAAHLEAVRAVVDADGHVTPEHEERYIRHSVHSTALLRALKERAEGLDVIITGPYLFGLTYDVARAFPEQTLLLPCFHDEPIARLGCWPAVYGNVGGLLLHSPEEKELMLARLGINHPTAAEIGTWLDIERVTPAPRPGNPYLVYCGRYSAQKNVPLLLDWMRRYQDDRPGRFDLVCLGQGEVAMPREPWLHDRGRVDERQKRATLAGACALVQLSRHESLSLVALEAWAQETPVIVHRDCAVLAGQVRRADGGMAVDDYAGFARILDTWWDDPNDALTHGQRGRGYVEGRYGSEAALRERLLGAIAELRVPLPERMRRRGLARARHADRGPWREALGTIVDNLLDAGPRPYRLALDVQPLRDTVHAGAGTRSTLVPVRIVNRGTHAAVADGPGRTLLWAEVRGTQTDAIVGTRAFTDLPDLLVPGATATAMLLVPVPLPTGMYTLHVGVEHPAGAGRRAGDVVRVALNVGAPREGESGLAPLLDDVRNLLVEARQAQGLPDDYVDVTEGWLARWKRRVKQKLLNNFKRAYVDVLSRQQSRVNRQLVAAVEQLVECCATLDHAARSLQARVEELEVSRGPIPAGVEAPQGMEAPHPTIRGEIDA